MIIAIFASSLTRELNDFLTETFGLPEWFLPVFLGVLVIILYTYRYLMKKKKHPYKKMAPWYEREGEEALSLNELEGKRL